MSNKNNTKKQHSSNRVAPTAKAGKRAGSLSTQAQAQRQAETQARREEEQAILEIATERVILAFRTEGQWAGVNAAHRYITDFNQRKVVIEQGKATFKGNVDKLAQLIAKRRNRKENLLFSEVSHVVTYHEFMTAQVQYKENK